MVVKIKRMVSSWAPNIRQEKKNKNIAVCTASDWYDPIQRVELLINFSIFYTFASTYYHIY